MLTLLLAVLISRHLRHDAYLKKIDEIEAEFAAGERGGDPMWPLPERPPELRWRMAREGHELIISYEIFNPGDKPLWIYDEIEGGPERVRVRRGESDAIASLQKGIYEYYACLYTHPIYWTYDVYARRIEPGEIVVGSARQALPLRADVVSDARQVLSDPVKQVRLEIGWTMEDDRYGPIYAIPEQEPRMATSPGWQRQRWLVSDPLPMPD